MTHIEKVIKKYKLNEVDIEYALNESIPLIKSTLFKKFGKINDDMIQESMILALKCFNDYKLDSGFSFSTYLCNTIRWGIGRYLWNDKLIRKPVHLLEKGIDTKSFKIHSYSFKFKNSNIDKEGNIMDILFQIEYFGENFEDSVMLNSILSKLKSEHKKVLTLWGIYGYTFKEIATIYNISTSGAEQKVKRSLEVARRLAKESEYSNEYSYTPKKTFETSMKTKNGKSRQTKYSKELLDTIRERKLTLREISAKYNITLSIIHNLDQRIKRGEL